jgi:hypothetical protein
MSEGNPKLPKRSAVSDSCRDSKGGHLTAECEGLAWHLLSAQPFVSAVSSKSIFPSTESLKDASLPAANDFRAVREQESYDYKKALTTPPRSDAAGVDRQEQQTLISMQPTESETDRECMPLPFLDNARVGKEGPTDAATLTPESNICKDSLERTNGVVDRFSRKILGILRRPWQWLIGRGLAMWGNIRQLLY